MLGFGDGPRITGSGVSGTTPTSWTDLDVFGRPSPEQDGSASVFLEMKVLTGSLGASDAGVTNLMKKKRKYNFIRVILNLTHTDIYAENQCLKHVPRRASGARVRVPRCGLHDSRVTLLRLGAGIRIYLKYYKNFVLIL